MLSTGVRAALLATALGAALSVTVATDLVLGQGQVPTQGPTKSPGALPVPARGETSYIPVAKEEEFSERYQRMSAQKAEVMKRQQALLEERYDLSDRPVAGVTMTRGKPLQGGVRVKLPAGVTWEQLAQMSPAEIRKQGLWPKGFLPLPHPFHDGERLEVLVPGDGRARLAKARCPAPRCARGASPARVPARRCPLVKLTAEVLPHLLGTRLTDIEHPANELKL